MFTKAAVFDCDLFGRFSGENFRRLTDGGESVHSIPCFLVIKTVVRLWLKRARLSFFTLESPLEELLAFPREKCRDGSVNPKI